MLSWFSGESKDSSTESNAETRQEDTQQGTFKCIFVVC